MRSRLGFRGHRFVGSVFALVLFGALIAANATASTVWVFTAPAGMASPPNYQAGIPVNLGNVFTVNTSFMVNALGAYYETDLVAPETVGLYDGSGNLLASAIVPLTNPVVDGYLFQSIAPVFLTAGNQYTVVEFVGPNPWSFGNAPTTASQVTFNYDDYNYTGALAFTTTTGGSGPAYYGANVGTATPEPGSLGLVAAVFALVGCLRYRKMRVRG